MTKTLIKYWQLACMLLLGCSFSACSDKDEPGSSSGMITVAEADQNLTFDAETTWHSITFTSRAAWTAQLAEKADWVKLVDAQGAGGSSQKLGFELTRNTTKDSRAAVVNITCSGETVKINLIQTGTDREMMDYSQIPNYDKFFFPGDPSYASSEESMLYSDSKYNWFCSKQSEHFFVFWNKEFGPDPNAASVPEWAKVDIDDLLEKAEQFFNTNINVLKMAVLGQGKSNLDKYKMQIWLIYDDGWVATGSGYGDKIGALWVTPSTCKPVGSTIAHEIGHSFQYQVYADALAAGTANNYNAGFRYGWGGNGGCTYWEQCAQWQSMRDYPAEMFYQDFNPWLVNYHRHFCHEWMRYQSYWLQSYWVQQRGIDVFGQIWRESRQPEDPIQTYMRLFLNNDTQAFWDEYYDYASRMVTYDIDNVRQYRNGMWGASSQYATSLFQIGDYEYQVGYNSVPETSGFNIIRLNVPQGGGNVSVDFKALAVGSSLASNDAGQYLKGDNEAVGGTVRKYNSNVTNNSTPDFRIGFVSTKSGVPTYGSMFHFSEGTATYTVPANAEELYLVVVPTPARYTSHAWDVDDLTDEQWPYKFKVSGTDLFGHMEINPNQNPTDLELTYNLTCDGTADAYATGAIDLTATGDIAKIAQAFVMQPAEIASITAPIGANQTANPAEGTVVFALMLPNGDLAYNYTANGGFYITAEGTVGTWGGPDPIFVEYDPANFIISYGHNRDYYEKGKLYNAKPCLVYTKNGKKYKVVFNMNMQY